MKIEIEFSETDRLTAAYYCDSCNCIIATALKNRGYNVHCVLPFLVELEDGVYSCEEANSEYVCLTYDSQYPPFYRPEVVGKKITLVSLDNDDKKREANANGGGDHQGSAGGVATPRHLSSPELGSAPEAVQVPVATFS